MRKEYNLENAKRGPVLLFKGKTRITIYLDAEILEEFRVRADQAGYGYQTMMPLENIFLKAENHSMRQLSVR
jgi:hypothetical protein